VDEEESASDGGLLESIRHSSYLFGAMTVLAARDAEQMLSFVAAAGEVDGEEPFAPELLTQLGKLVHADKVMYCEQDRVRERSRYGIARPNDTKNQLSVPYWEIAGDHPVCSRHNGAEFGALKVSDFLSTRQLHRSRIYALWFHPLGFEHEMTVAIPSPPWHTKTFLFDRGPGRDFTERDRNVLNALQPHFAWLWRAARTRRRLTAAMAALESGSESATEGVILLGPGGAVDVVSPAARRLLRKYFDARLDSELPATLAEWVNSDAPTMFRRRDDRRLTIDRSGASLMVEERHDSFSLTPRERQILGWVARGKTNPEIAEILWIAPSTVRKHLENIYAKLGVSTRTAAAARLLDALNDDAT
jgi:DNA-binding CsgD family transcriptional regulator